MNFLSSKFNINSGCDGVLSISFSPNGELLSFSSFDSNVYVWKSDCAEGCYKLEGHRDMAIFCDFSPTGQQLVSSDFDSSIHIWNVGEKEGNLVTKLNGHDEAVECVRYNFDGSSIFSTGDDGKIILWSVKKKKEIIRLLNCHPHGGFKYVFTGIFLNDHTILSGGEDRSIKIWDLSQKGKCVQSFIGAHDQSVLSVCQNKVNEYEVASSSFDKSIKIHDLRMNKVIHTYSIHDRSVQEVDYHPSGRYLLSCSEDKTIKIIDDGEKKVIFSVSLEESQVYCVQFSPDGSIVASGGDDSLRIWKSNLKWNSKTSLSHQDLIERIQYLFKVQETILEFSVDRKCSHLCVEFSNNVLIQKKLYLFKWMK